MNQQKAEKKMSNSSRFQRGIRSLWKQRELQAMVWPGLIWMAVFSYVPLVFLYIAFTDYRISTPLFENNFVGLKHFAAFLSDDRFWRSVYNTLGMSALRITLGFCIPIFFALMLNEIKNAKFKRLVQTLSYMPHFISWAIFGGILLTWLSQSGIINQLMMALGLQDKPILYARQAGGFRLNTRLNPEDFQIGRMLAFAYGHKENGAVFSHAERLKTIKQQQLALISYRLNEEMSRLNDAIYEGSYNAPVLDFTDTGYNFFTPDDTGTGIAYKGLVVYDLAVLRLTRLPVLVHDSVVLKQISDDAIEKIIELYFTCGKQVIIALDKQDSYSEKTSRLLSESAVLRLTSNGQELFGRSWG